MGTTTYCSGAAFCDAALPDCVGNGIYFDKVSGGVFGGNFSTPVGSTGEAYLRVVRISDAYHALFSANGSDWLVIGMHTAEALPRVGLTAAQDYDQVGVPADFDFFTISQIKQYLFLPLVMNE